MHAAIDRMYEIIHVELICEAGSCSLRLCTCCYQLLPLAVWTKLCCVPYSLKFSRIKYFAV